MMAPANISQKNIKSADAFHAAIRFIFLSSKACEAELQQVSEMPGRHWADKAADHVLSNLRRPSVNNLMVCLDLNLHM